MTKKTRNDLDIQSDFRCHPGDIPIPRVPASDLPVSQFREQYFRQAKPVIITGTTDNWPARQWTVENLMARVGENKVWIRGKTDKHDYKV